MSEEVLDLTQEDDEGDNKDDCVDNDAAFDAMFPAATFNRVDSGISSGSGTSYSSSSNSTAFSSESDKLSRKNLECKETKSKKKSTIAYQRETKKRRLAEEKAARQAVNEANKIYKPGECMKYMCVEMHSSLARSWRCADVERELTAVGARLVTDDGLCDENLVLWSRIVQPTFKNNNGVAELTPRRQSCPYAVYVMSAEDLFQHVQQHSLSQHVANIRNMAGERLTLVAFGVKDYLKSTSRNIQSKDRKLKEIEMEMAFTDVVVSSACDVTAVNSPGELALLLAHCTKAVAEQPYKQAKRSYDEQADFYMRGDNKKCVPVDKDGNGLSRLWQQMVAVLPLSSLETSRSLCAQYKSPLALFEALESANGINEVADVGISRAAVPGSRCRRLGPEFARKLHILFTAEDGDVLLQ